MICGKIGSFPQFQNLSVGPFELCHVKAGLDRHFKEVGDGALHQDRGDH